MAVRLGEVCRQARLAAGVRAIEVAMTAGVSEPTLSKFESGYRGAWRMKTDDIVEAYERECGLTDGSLWRLAVLGE